LIAYIRVVSFYALGCLASSTWALSSFSSQRSVLGYLAIINAKRIKAHLMTWTASWIASTSETKLGVWRYFGGNSSMAVAKASPFEVSGSHSALASISMSLTLSWRMVPMKLRLSSCCLDGLLPFSLWAGTVVDRFLETWPFP
jgi:hypothetical protein